MTLRERMAQINETQLGYGHFHHSYRDKVRDVDNRSRTWNNSTTRIKRNLKCYTELTFPSQIRD